MGACCAQGDSRSSELDKKQRQDMRQENKVKKLLLLGAGGSGKSTFFKQLRILHGTGIKHQEMENVYKQIVHSNVIVGMKSLIQAYQDTKDDDGELSGIEISDDTLAHMKFIGDFDEDNFVTQRAGVQGAISHLWEHGAIQHVWSKRAKHQIQDSAKHFFKNIDRITTPDYLPTDEDVLYARIRTTGIVEQEFTIKGNRFQVFDVGGQRNERKKWIHCFEKVTGVIFLASLSAYDQVLYEDEATNRMREALDLFKQICNSRWFKETAMILFLNKKDLFKIQIEERAEYINHCFPEYKGDLDDVIESREYIKEQFVLMNAVKKMPNGKSKKKALFVHFTCVIDRNHVEKIFRDVQSLIIQANLEKAALI